MGDDRNGRSHRTVPAGPPANGRGRPQPHQLCHFHFSHCSREAALPIVEADRHAKKDLNKRVRGVRPIERAVEGRGDLEAELVRGYAAMRSAITDDGRVHLDATGLRLNERLGKVADSLERVFAKR